MVDARDTKSGASGTSSGANETKASDVLKGIASAVRESIFLAMVGTAKENTVGTTIEIGGIILYLVTSVRVSETFVASSAEGAVLSSKNGDIAAADGSEGVATANLDDNIAVEHLKKCDVPSVECKESENHRG